MRFITFVLIVIVLLMIFFIPIMEALFFLDLGYGYNAQESVIIDEFNVNGNNSIAISGILCDAYNDTFTAFKYRLEHEQK